MRLLKDALDSGKESRVSLAARGAPMISGVSTNVMRLEEERANWGDWDASVTERENETLTACSGERVLVGGGKERVCEGGARECVEDWERMRVSR